MEDESPKLKADPQVMQERKASRSEYYAGDARDKEAAETEQDQEIQSDVMLSGTQWYPLSVTTEGRRTVLSGGQAIKVRQSQASENPMLSSERQAKQFGMSAVTSKDPISDMNEGPMSGAGSDPTDYVEVDGAEVVLSGVTSGQGYTDPEEGAILSDVIASEVVTSGPVTSDPMPSDQILSDVQATNAIATEPFASEPVVSEPIASEPVASEPIASEVVFSPTAIAEEVISDQAIEEEAELDAMNDKLDQVESPRSPRTKPVDAEGDSEAEGEITQKPVVPTGRELARLFHENLTSGEDLDGRVANEKDAAKSQSGKESAAPSGAEFDDQNLVTEFKRNSVGFGDGQGASASSTSRKNTSIAIAGDSAPKFAEHSTSVIQTGLQSSNGSQPSARLIEVAGQANVGADLGTQANFPIYDGDDEIEVGGQAEAEYLIDANNLNMLDRIQVSSDREPRVGAIVSRRVSSLEASIQKAGSTSMFNVRGAEDSRLKESSTQLINQQEQVAGALRDLESVPGSANISDNRRVDLNSQQLDQMQWAGALTSERRRQVADVLGDLQASSYDTKLNSYGDNTPTHLAASDVSPQAALTHLWEGAENSKHFVARINEYVQDAPPAQGQLLDGSNPYQSLAANELTRQETTQEADVKKFEKAMKKRIALTKQMMLAKQDINAESFYSHEHVRRKECSYKVGVKGKKKPPVQQAYEQRMNDLLYMDSFDRKMVKNRTPTLSQALQARKQRSVQNCTAQANTATTTRNDVIAQPSRFSVPRGSGQTVASKPPITDASVFLLNSSFNNSVSQINDKCHSVAAHKDAEAAVIIGHAFKLKDESRVKRLKMSQYFKRQDSQSQNQEQRRYTTTAQALLDQSKLNLDLDVSATRATVKLRISKPPVQGLRKREERLQSRYQTYQDEKINVKGKPSVDTSLTEIQLLAAPAIFHSDEHSLKHEMIDTKKAKSIATALSKLKKKLVTQGDQIEDQDGVSVLDHGKLSVNLAAYQKSFEHSYLKYKSSAVSEEHHDQEQLDSEQEQPKKVTEKQIFEKEVRRKKREWRAFLRFAKKNPETLLGIADQDSSLAPNTGTTSMPLSVLQGPRGIGLAQRATTAGDFRSTNNQQPFSSLLHEPPALVGLKVSGGPVRPQSGKIMSHQLPSAAKQEYSTRDLDNLRLQRQRHTQTQFRINTSLSPTLSNNQAIPKFNLPHEFSSNGMQTTSKATSPDYKHSMQGFKEQKIALGKPFSTVVAKKTLTKDKSGNVMSETNFAVTDDQTEATEAVSYPVTKSSHLGEPIVDLTLTNTQQMRQSMRYSMDPSLNPIQEEIRQTNTRNTMLKPNAGSLLSQAQLKGALAQGSRRRTIMSAQHGRPKPHPAVGQSSYAGSTLPQSKEVKKKRLQSSKTRSKNPRMGKQQNQLKRVFSLDPNEHANDQMLSNQELLARLSSIPSSKLGRQTAKLKLPRQRAQTACNEEKRVRNLRLARTRTKPFKPTSQPEGATINVSRSYATGTALNLNLSEVVSIDSIQRPILRQGEDRGGETRNVQEQMFGGVKYQDGKGGFEPTQTADTNLNVQSGIIDGVEGRSEPGGVQLAVRPDDNSAFDVLENETMMTSQQPPFTFDTRAKQGDCDQILDEGQNNSLSQERSERRYPHDILKKNQQLMLKSALNDIGHPVQSKDVQQKKQMWERLSVRGLMDKVEHLFSLYPFTNAKILEDERQRLLALRNRPLPPPYIMADDLMAKLEVPKLDEFGPGGLLGYTRAQLIEMERLANLTPSSHTSSIQREQFQQWKHDVKRFHKEVVLLEFDQKHELFTMQEIIQSINYLKN